MAEVPQKRLRECVDDNLNFTECPECGDDSFSSSQGVAMHYSYNNEGSLKYLFQCDVCGRLKFGTGGGDTYCSKWCEVYDRVGTFKHFNEDFLREEVEQKGKSGMKIAKDIGVNKSTVWKWIEKHDIGDEYQCPSCSQSYSTKQGVSKHHKHKHNESISGSTYICEYCGDENWTPRSESDNKFPKYCGDDCFGKSIEGEKNPNKDAERKQKISDGLKKAYDEGRKKSGRRKTIEVEETGHTVDSSWEKEVDILLESIDIPYEYNGKGSFKRYKVDDFTHAPDFIIPQNKKDIVIEVKSSQTVHYQKEKANTIADSLTDRDDVFYIVYGDSDVDISSDCFVEYGKEIKLKELIQNKSIKYERKSIFDY